VERAHRPHQRPGPPARRRSAAERGTEVAGCALGGAPGAVDACPGGALGRSRGGLTTKLHLAADARGRPLVIRLTEGQAADDLRLAPATGLPVLAHWTPRPAADPPAAARGRSRLHHRFTRAALRHRAIGHTIPERAAQQAWRARQGSRGGHPPAFDRDAYHQRNVVERCFNRLKQN
jgi:transposase